VLRALGLVALAVRRTAVVAKASGKRLRRSDVHAALGACQHLKGLLRSAPRRGLPTG